MRPAELTLYEERFWIASRKTSNEKTRRLHSLDGQRVLHGAGEQHGASEDEEDSAVW